MQQWKSFMVNKRIIVLSDIHANINAYKVALKLARQIGFDQLVNLGDLLTYGCDTTEVLDETSNAVKTDNMILIKGNHDQLYFDILCGNYSYYNTLPSWIQESIEWTNNNTYLGNYETRYNWQESYKFENIYFAHANPFNYGDWTYLDTNEKYIKSANDLSIGHNTIGVFGHTHRQKITTVSNDNKCAQITKSKISTSNISLKYLTFIINLDSIGQPRNSIKKSTFLVINKKNDRYYLEFIDIPYDMNKHKAKIQKALLSKRTRKKIISYF